jgi:murein DD-endopeptidase MepM/ murein hydrolase activator NlpD
MKTVNHYNYPIDITKARKTYDESPAHKGRLRFAIDFIVPEGTPIKAALGGKIVDMKQDSDVSGKTEEYDKHGNYIEIEHANRECSIYEHIKKDGSLVKVGERVKTGQMIGYSGKTGWVAHLGPHLHFDVHKYKSNNPEDYETAEIKWKK